MKFYIITLLLTFLSINTKFIEIDNKIITDYKNKIKLLQDENVELKKFIKDIYYTSYIVKVTGYHPIKKETDSTPNITADGTVINDINNASTYHYIAISRDFLKSGIFKYGDYVYIKGTINNIDGIYQIRDTMSERFKNHADILLSPHEKAITSEKVLLYKLTTEQKNILNKILVN